MGTSCNGCRVLRKGCSESCILRPCLHWITTAESQANATIFLAKFYGRAGLTNLISNGPEHLRPAIFRSLLYDACGRMLDPIYGSLGLLWSGNWADCQAGVDSILRGSFQAGRRGKFMFPDCEMMAPMKGMASRELQRSVEANDRFKRFSDAKAKRRERERAPTSNHIDLNSKSDDWDDRGNKVQKGENDKFNGTYLNTFPTFLSGQQQQDIEIHAAQSEMECWNDLVCTLKSSEAEADACNAVELDLTLGSQRLDFSSSS